MGSGGVRTDDSARHPHAQSLALIEVEGRGPLEEILVSTMGHVHASAGNHETMDTGAGTVKGVAGSTEGETGSDATASSRLDSGRNSSGSGSRCGGEVDDDDDSNDNEAAARQLPEASGRQPAGHCDGVVGRILLEGQGAETSSWGSNCASPRSLLLSPSISHSDPSASSTPSPSLESDIDASLLGRSDGGGFTPPRDAGMRGAREREVKAAASGVASSVALASSSAGLSSSISDTDTPGTQLDPRPKVVVQSQVAAFPGSGVGLAALGEQELAAPSGCGFDPLDGALTVHLLGSKDALWPVLEIGRQGVVSRTLRISKENQGQEGLTEEEAASWAAARKGDAKGSGGYEDRAKVLLSELASVAGQAAVEDPGAILVGPRAFQEKYGLKTLLWIGAWQTT